MKKYLSILFVVMLVVVGCGKKDVKESNDSKSGSNSSSSYSKAPDTIESCPGCVYSNTEARYYEDYYYDKLDKERDYLEKNQYTTNWKEAASESYVGDMFFGYVLDSNNQITRGFVCAVVDDIPFCLEGSSSDDEFVDDATRDEIYNRNNEVIKSLFGVEFNEGYQGVEANVGSDSNTRIHIYYQPRYGSIRLKPSKYVSSLCNYKVGLGYAAYSNEECNK